MKTQRPQGLPVPYKNGSIVRGNSGTAGTGRHVARTASGLR